MSRRISKILGVITALSILILLMLSTPNSFAAGACGGWSQAFHDSRHTGKSDYVAYYDSPSILWKEKVGGYGGGDVLQYGEYLIVSASNELKVMDYHNRKIMWHREFESIKSVGIYNGTIYVLDNGSLSAVNMNGKSIWKISHVYYDSLQVNSNGLLLLNNNFKGDELCLISREGKIIKKFNYELLGVPAFYKEDIYLLAKDESNASLYAINMSGDAERIFPLSECNIHGEIGIGDDGTVYALVIPNSINATARLYAIDDHGKLRWKADVGNTDGLVKYNGNHLFIGQTHSLYVTFNNAANNKLTIAKIVSGENGGKLQWKKSFKLYKYYQASTDADGNFYVTSGKNMFFINHTGVLKWNLSVSDCSYPHESYDIHNVFVIAPDNVIYILLPTGYLCAIGEEPVSDYFPLLLLISIFTIVSAGAIIWRVRKREGAR
ncbi:MAG: hypothetical protein GXO25_02200 [Euryarchaeota archaeon]|nr:hypothetical protein [Euryarchaeota archaeon]